MNTQSFDWTLIALFSLCGIIMGALSIRGFTQKLEPFLWLAFGIVVALVVSKNIDHKVFLHAFLIGISWGLLNGIIQSGFFEMYLSNNPGVAERFQQDTPLNPRLFMLLMGPLYGAVTGAIIGGIALLLKRLW